jgi:hypothetical protein
MTTSEAPAPSAAAVAADARPRLGRVIGPAWIWLVTLALVLYLGIDGGGYDLVVRSQAGIAVWWVVLVGAVLGLLPAGRVGRAGWLAIALFFAFAAWSTASALWSISPERSLQEASRLAAYLGMLLLAAATWGDRDRALRHAVGAAATAIVIIALLALLTRLRPDLIPAAQTTGEILPGAQARLSWPLNYWNALGALAVLAVPLLLALATSARWLAARALAAAVLPAVILTGYLTFSRGAAIAGGAAVVVFVALAPQRAWRILAGLLCAAGGAALVAAASARPAVENGLTTSSAAHQGSSLSVLVILVCVAVGLLHAGLSFAAGRLPSRLLTVAPRPAAAALAVGIVVIVVVAVAVGAPHRLVHAWDVFKQPRSAHLHEDTLRRFTALSGNGRYTYWKTAVQALGGHWLGGFGLGTFQLVWLPRAPFLSYVVNAHSLYVETLTEVGIPGLVLLVAFLATLMTAAVRTVRAADPAVRCLGAAVAAAIAAFAVSAAFDWIWQMPVLPAVLLLLGAAVVSPRARAAVALTEPPPGARAAGVSRIRRAGRIVPRLAGAALAAACLVVIGVPLVVTQDVRASQADSRAGHQASALLAARRALGVEPGSASAALQAALVSELEGRLSQAVAYATKATSDEPASSSAWLVRSRLEAESGQAAGAVRSYGRARADNPRGLLFSGG